MKVMPFLRRSSFLVALLAPILYACTESECTDLDAPQLVVQFKTRYRATRQQRERDTLIEIRSVSGAGQPDSIYSTSQKTNNLVLPLNQGAEETTFMIEWKRYNRAVGTANPVPIDSTTEKLTVRYTRKAFFVSDACGFNLRYNDLELIKEQPTFPSNFPSDSIQVIKNVVDESNEPNIKIYF